MLNNDKENKRYHISYDYEFLAEYQIRHNKPSGWMPLLLDAVNKLVPPGPRQVLLEVGGGTNSYLNFVKGDYVKLVSDYVPQALQGMSGVERLAMALPQTALRSGVAEMVSACAVIEHLPPDIYQESLEEIARLSRRFLALTGPFYQNLESARVKCKQCGAIFQSDGHFRRYELNDLYNLQDFFGGLIMLGFCGTPRTLFMTKVRYRLKQIRYLLRRIGLNNYPNIPFLKCPACQAVAFHNYEDYKALVDKIDLPCWLTDTPFSHGNVAQFFFAVFDMQANHIGL